MTAYTTTLVYSSSTPASPTWNPEPSGGWPLDLDEDDTLTISFSSFPTGSTLSTVTLTPATGTAITFPPSPSSTSDFLITAVATTPPYDVTNSTFTVTITDNEDPTPAVTYQMVVSGIIGGAVAPNNVWTGDPEVINNPG